MGLFSSTAVACWDEKDTWSYTAPSRRTSNTVSPGPADDTTTRCCFVPGATLTAPGLVERTSRLPGRARPSSALSMVRVVVDPTARVVELLHPPPPLKVTLPASPVRGPGPLSLAEPQA